MILNFSETINGVKSNFVEKILSGEKIHTIRRDSNNRWFAGRKIQFYTGARTKKAKKFGESVCVSVQSILIIKGCWVWIDGSELTKEQLNSDEIDVLAKNDGLKSGDLLNFIRETYGDDFSGKIIHWTDYRY